MREIIRVATEWKNFSVLLVGVTAGLTLGLRRSNLIQNEAILKLNQRVELLEELGSTQTELLVSIVDKIKD